MSTNMNINTNTNQTHEHAAADAPQPASMLTPDEFISELRALAARIPEVSPLTAEQRRILRRQGTLPDVIVRASISVIGASDTVTTAVGQPADDVHKLVDEKARWQVAEDELRSMLNGVEGANLVRHQKVSIIAGQAYLIAKQLARVPENVALVPHVDAVKRLKAIMRRKKRSSQDPAPETPSDVPMTPKA